jgi:hypothetical protein
MQVLPRELGGKADSIPVDQAAACSQGAMIKACTTQENGHKLLAI